MLAPTAQIKDVGCKAGVVLNPATPLSAIEYVLDVVDLVLVMSVNPGFGGQSFIQSQVGKVRALRRLCQERGLDPWIEVDGGVVPGNAWQVIEAGANALVSGSGVFKAADYARGESGPEEGRTFVAGECSCDAGAGTRRAAGNARGGPLSSHDIGWEDCPWAPPPLTGDDPPSRAATAMHTTRALVSHAPSTQQSMT